MMRLARLGLAIILICLAAVPGITLAEEGFPNRPVEVIVPWAAGGGVDLIFRALGSVFPKYANGQPLLVKNIAGSGGALGFQEAMKMRPDGYGLTVGTTPFITKIHMSVVSFQVDSFAPVMMFADIPCYIMVPADSPYKDLRDYVAAAKKNPGQISLGNSGTGGGTHLVGLAFQKYAKINLKHIPFDGGAKSFDALANRLIDSAIGSSPEGIPEATEGKLRILAVFGGKRLTKFPGVKTAKEQGYNFQGTMWRGVMTAKGTPSTTIKQLDAIFKHCIEDPGFIKLAEENMWPLKYMNSRDFWRYMREEDSRYKKLIIEYKLGDRYK